MAIEDLKEKDLDFFEIIKFLLKNRRMIIVVGIIATVISSIVALLMPNVYRSTVTVFPAKVNNISFTESFNQNIMKIGSDEEASQMLQILQSAEVRNRIIYKYDLYQHYDISRESSFSLTKINQKFNEMVSFQKNKYGSIIIEVLDTDKDTAAFIANDVSSFLDTVKNRILKSRAQEALSIIKTDYDKIKEEILLLQDTIRYFEQLGVSTTEEKASLLDGLSNAMDSRNQNAISYYQDRIDINTKFGSIYKEYRQQLGMKMGRFSEMERTYRQTQSDAKSLLSHKFTVEIATPADKKSYPIRWLIVLSSCIAAEILLIVFLVFKDRIADLRKNL